MPRQLPGMRWDHERQRYFPLATNHSTRPPAHSGPVVVNPPRRLLASYRALADLRSVCRTARKDALVHQIQSSQMSLTNKTTRSTLPLHGLVSAFQTVSHSGRVSSFVGDSLGWFYSSVVDLHHEESNVVNAWQCHYHLSSEVSSIVLSPTACVATSFGPECRILYVPLDSPVEGVHVARIDSRIVHDVWTADLYGSRLVLGANKQVVVIDDIAACASLHRLPTQSDVFALAQHENVLYAGLRSGGIIRFDTRVQRSQACSLFDSITRRGSSITGLKHIHDHQLLISFINGQMLTFDLRFPFRTPLISFTGNLNSYTTRLPLVTDPYEKFLFAAGQDNRVRLWSLITGGPPLRPAGTDPTVQKALERPFEHHIAALQVVEEREGMCLWAASGTELYKYTLGHQSGMGI